MVPLNLEAGLQLNHGRAFVGFTAGTGKDTWQVREANLPRTMHARLLDFTPLIYTIDVFRWGSDTQNNV